jgi:uncharacterized protein (DUF427 family)
MKAIIDGAVIADAPQSELISIEGNYYFPPSSLDAAAFSDSPTPYTCPWKGVAQYHDVSAADAVHHDAAWSYPDPYPASFDRVGQDYSGYVAFDKKQVVAASGSCHQVNHYRIIVPRALCADVGSPTKAAWAHYAPGEPQPSICS